MPANQRLPIGQLLVRSLRLFREDLFAMAEAAGYQPVIREAHLQVFGIIDRGGNRLTELAARANMTPPAMGELVDQLEAAGFLERTPDPTDGRAKLIRLTAEGRQVVRDALKAVAELEATYSDLVGRQRFEDACLTLQELIGKRGSTDVR